LESRQREKGGVLPRWYAGSRSKNSGVRLFRQKAMVLNSKKGRKRGKSIGSIHSREE